MNRNKSTTSLCIAALLSGCTSLAVHRFDPATPNREGVAYVLPFTQYTITQTWRIADCTPEKERISVKVEAVIGQADDANHQYLIDPSSIQGLLTRSEFNTTFHENSNMLKSVNVTVEDRTGPFIGNIVRTAVALAPIVAGLPPLPPPGVAPPPPQSACTPDTERALERANSLKGQLDEVTRRVTDATDAVTLINASVTQMGPAIDDATRARFGEAVRTLNQARAQQATLTTQLGDALKAISFQRVLRWPTESNCFESTAPTSIDPRALARWLRPGATVPSVPQVHLAMERVGSFGQQPTTCPARPHLLANGRPAYPEPAGERDGLRYRMPAQGRLVACSESPCSSSAPATVLLAVEGPVAQLGYVNLLPVRNRAFGTTTFAAEFRPGGNLASAGYAQKAAPLEAASDTVASAATSLAPIFDPAQRLARGTAYLTALKARRDALAALETPPQDPTAQAIASLGADTSLLNARIAELQAEITLQDLQARRHPQ
jgi:hypothetical protein